MGIRLVDRLLCGNEFEGRKDSNGSRSADRADDKLSSGPRPASAPLRGLPERRQFNLERTSPRSDGGTRQGPESNPKTLRDPTRRHRLPETGMQREPPPVLTASMTASDGGCRHFSATTVRPLSQRRGAGHPWVVVHLRSLPRNGDEDAARRLARRACVPRRNLPAGLSARGRRAAVLGCLRPAVGCSPSLDLSIGRCGGCAARRSTQ